ncbi:MAG: hypothetical protein Q4E22_02800 [Coriobacteriia bacterium]|nr:hypothetical protein [Coriobacteriia bacterium]
MALLNKNENAGFHPLILGGDIGVYALARAFWEAYHVRSTVISGAALGPIAKSAIVDVIALGMGASVQDIAQAAYDEAARLQKRYPNKNLVLLTNSDSQVRAVIAMAEKLKEYYKLSMIDEELLNRVQDKASFARLAQAYKMDTPRTIEVDLATYKTPDWKEAKLPGSFPLIVKPANSAFYERLHFEGMKKVYHIKDKQALDDLWETLYRGGAKQRFVVQEEILGDDQQMLSITAYCDQNHRVTMLGSAQVLLEEHAPSALGNPAAMITEAFDDLYAQAEQFLSALKYTGFANFDVKRDLRTNKAYFLEVNPRIGRNNYYNTGAGLNPAIFMIEDVINHKSLEQQRISDEVLYTVVTPHLLKKYVNEENKARINRLVKAKKVVNPLYAAYDKGLGLDTLKRRAWIVAHTMNHYKKFKTYYPKASESGF